MADERFKLKEIYREIRALPPVIVRADGRNFKESLARLHFEKPYDEKFEKAMVAAGHALMEASGLGPSWVYTFSDEFNIFFKELPFDGRVEKLDSVVPSFLASALTIALDVDTPLAFDARVIPLHYEDVGGYLQWRQAEAWRNHMQSYGFYTLIKEGLAEKQASKKLLGMKFEDIHELMWQRGVNLNETPGWQRKGIFIHRKTVAREGFDPLKKKKVRVKRLEVQETWDPPLFGSKEGEALLKGL
jgi:tRNA(His) 5'-end guanylyltransferase